MVDSLFCIGAVEGRFQIWLGNFPVTVQGRSDAESIMDVVFLVASRKLSLEEVATGKIQVAI
jgi:hypothetical protein